VRVSQAVILISSGNRPGSKILGLAPLERTLLAASQSGVKDFILVAVNAEDEAEILSPLLRDKRFRERGIQPEFVPLARLAELGTGGRVKSRFWLMEDRLVCSPENLTKASSADPSLSRDVLVMNGTDGEASFAGLALCLGGSFARIASVLANRGTTELDPKTTAEIFPPSRVQVVIAGPDFCESVKSQTAVRRAHRYLIGTARKPTDGFYSRNVNRPISTFLTSQLLKLNVTPMEISVVVLAVGILSGWLEGRGGYRNAALGALLFEIASIIDGCDGENARLTYRISKFGGTFDIAGDAATFVFFFLNLPIGLYRTSRNDFWLALGALSFVSMILFYVQMGRFTRRTGIGNNIVAIVKDIEKSSERPGFAGKLDWAAAKIAPIYRRDFFATWAFIIIACGGAGLFMGIIAVLAPVEAVYMYFYSRRRLKEALVEA